MSYSTARNAKRRARAIPAALGWHRYVALGDSLTAGRGDVSAEGRRIGWARRLAEILSGPTEAGCQFTNLAVDGADVATVVAHQLPLVKKLQPDLVSVTVGMNDVRLHQFSPAAFSSGMGRLLAGLADTGATVITCTLPDISAVVALPAEHVLIAHRRLRQASEIIRAQAARYRVMCLDTWAMPDAATDPALFTADRLHPNAAGHSVLAEAFADLLATEPGQVGSLPAAD